MQTGTGPKGCRYLSPTTDVSRTEGPTMTDPGLLLPVWMIPPDGRQWDGTVTAAALDLPADESTPGFTIVNYALQATLTRGGVLVQGRAWTRLQCCCDRCLESYEQDACTEQVCHFFEAVGEDTTLDLTENLREDILLLLPQRTVCRPDCRGLCGVCGCNRNRETCACSQTPTGNSPWAQLDVLNIDTEPNDL